MSRKKAVLSEHGGKSAATTKDDARPRRERLPGSVLEELWSIWQADPRVPSVKSRRSWAISRNVHPRLVDSWFLRRRTCAKKAGKSISNESYDLPLDPLITPKREPSMTPVESVFDLPSDDTLVLVYPPYTDELNDIQASSDTFFEDVPVESKGTEIPTYKEALQRPYTEHQRSQPEPWPSSTDLDVAQDRCEDIVSSEDSSFPICNQGQGKQPDFTCILCSGQDVVTSDSGATSDAKGDSFFSSPCLDFYPGTLSELSAIPFLSRTPHAVLPANALTRRWSNVEDELEYLANSGKLDFSFLDVPHLASMELLA